MSATGPTEHRIAGAHGDICYFEWGRPSDPTLLLLHATSFHARCWDRVVAALPMACHVIAIDMPGHGRSHRPERLDNWRQLSADIGALINGLELDAIMGVGHSLGGYVMMHAASCWPERFRQLVLIEPVALAPDHYNDATGSKFADLSDHPILRRRHRWESPEQMEEALGKRLPYRIFDPEVLRDYCRYGLLPTEDGMELACPPRLEVSGYMGTRHHNPYEIAPDMIMPTTIVRAGQHQSDHDLDFLSSTTWEGLAGVFPNGLDIHLPHLTHLMPMQEPETIARILADAHY